MQQQNDHLSAFTLAESTLTALLYESDPKWSLSHITKQTFKGIFINVYYCRKSHNKNFQIFGVKRHCDLIYTILLNTMKKVDHIDN